MDIPSNLIENADRISTVEELEQQYGPKNPKALIKEIDYISDHYRAFIEAAPFVVVSTSGEEGLDSSPRGDPAGFVHMHDQKTVLMPDRRGNNRLDTLRNLMEDNRVSLLFLIPGIGETLRINGTAEILVNDELCAMFEMNGKPASSVMKVTVDRVYFQCQKALARSGLWKAETQIDRKSLPTAGDILTALSKDPFDGKAYDDGYPEHMKNTIY